MAALLRLKGEYRKALDHASLSLRYYAEAGDRAGVCRLHLLISAIYDDMGRGADARRELESCLRLVE